VGYYAIQWATMAGARVIATASNPQDRDLCLQLGAASVCNHREAGWGQSVLACNDGQKVDRVVDVEFGANLDEVLACIRIGGTIATYSSTQVREPQLPFLQMMFMDLTIRMVLVYAMPQAAKQQAIAAINQALAGRLLQHRIAHTLPLHEMVRAHELIEQGGFGGCVVVNVE
jgi:NADPH2:quinone reductase